MPNLKQFIHFTDQKHIKTYESHVIPTNQNEHIKRKKKERERMILFISIAICQNTWID